MFKDLKIRKNEKGFTLIELLIVVAIIAILAAIAIPQFAAYRMRGFNSAANSDIRNAKTSEEALFADFQTYGRSIAIGTLATADSTTGAGLLIQGPQISATATLSGAMLSGPRAGDGLAVAVGTSVSNNVNLVSHSMAPVAPAVSSPSYVMATKHTQGDRVFGTETESTAIMVCQNGAWAGTALAATGLPATFPGTATIGIDITGACGGVAPLSNWSAM